VKPEGSPWLPAVGVWKLANSIKRAIDIRENVGQSRRCNVVVVGDDRFQIDVGLGPNFEALQRA
jgi:hypothetical protein